MPIDPKKNLYKSIVLSRDLDERIKVAAKQYATSTSTIIRMALIEWLEKHEKK